MSICSEKLLRSSSLSLGIKGLYMELKLNLSTVNGKIYCTFIISVSIDGVVCINKLKLNSTQVIISYGFCFDVKAKQHKYLC